MTVLPKGSGISFGIISLEHDQKLYESNQNFLQVDKDNLHRAAGLPACTCRMMHT